MKRKLECSLPTYLPGCWPFVGVCRVAPWHGRRSDWAPQRFMYIEIIDPDTREVLATTLPDQNWSLVWEAGTTLRHFMEHDIELPTAWGYRHWRDTYTGTNTPVPASANWLGDAFKHATR